MRRLLSLLLFVSSLAWADTTSNLITNQPGISGTGVWTGIGGYSQLGGTHPIDLWGCCTSYSGAAPFHDTATWGGNGQSGQFIWSYGQATVQQIIAINQALSSVNAGVQISGYNWGYDVRNMNGNNGQATYSDVLTATTFMTSNTGVTLLSDTRTYSGAMDWTRFTGTVNAATPVDLATAGNLGISFTSGDSGFWAGYYGPQVRDVSLSLNYTAAPADPCTLNPSSSPTCPGYANIQTSGNLVPNPNHWTTDGNVINNTYAINQALGLSGSQVRIHGFDYGYQYNLGGQYCNNMTWVIPGVAYICNGFGDPQVAVNFSVKNSSGDVIYSQNHTHTGSNTGNRSQSYQYRFSTSQDLLNLGAIGFTGTTSSNSALFGMYSRAVYTNDSCTSDPLSSPTCPGYAVAYHDLQCSANPLYAATCPGYAVAYFDQQCSINPLYNAACPGYAVAYHDQQCSLNPLYAVTCTGYQEAYYDQQCSLNTLYDTGCPGYAAAYLNQQCSINPLYSNQCEGYAVAQEACTLNPLTASYCPSYTFATNACSANSLTYTYCPNYQTALAACSTDAQSNTLCPGYSTTTATTDTSSAVATTVSTTEPTVNVKDDGTVETSVAIVADSAVNSVLTKSTETTTAVEVATATEPVVLAQASTTSATTATVSAPTATEQKATAAAVESVVAAVETRETENADTKTDTEKKDSESKEKASSSDKSDSKSDTKSKAAARREAVKQAATAKARELANDMSKAATIEAQTASQATVLGLMNYTPGFDSYNNAIVPDVNARAMARQYNRDNVDNRSVLRQLNGASDRMHADMVDQQYQLRR